MKQLTESQKKQCNALNGLVDHYYAGSTASFVKSEGGNSGNVSKMRRGLKPVASYYLPLIGCKLKPNKVA